MGMKLVYVIFNFIAGAVVLGSGCSRRLSEPAVFGTPAVYVDYVSHYGAFVGGALLLTLAIAFFAYIMDQEG